LKHIILSTAAVAAIVLAPSAVLASSCGGAPWAHFSMLWMTWVDTWSFTAVAAVASMHADHSWLAATMVTFYNNVAINVFLLSFLLMLLSFRRSRSFILAH